ncbi:sensor histidine kinase [Nocardioides limicola]|uniref:sensor histidine kinase n=1 Tax=Nocardioides limicola TaxID=2803368 RepID=UPI00193BC9E0|nr:sensor histidine kinase [Nocardioides sp. DJM-14]
MPVRVSIDLGVRTTLALGGAGAGALLLSLALGRPATWQAAAWALVFVLPLYGVGLLAWSLRPDQPMARLLAVVASAQALFSGGVAVGYDVWPELGHSMRQTTAVSVTVLEFVAVAAGATLVLLFPVGRPEGRVDRVLLTSLWGLAGAGVLARLVGSSELEVNPEFAREVVANPLHAPALAASLPGAVESLDGLLGWAYPVAFVVLALRYRRARPERRRQMRWLFLIPVVSLGLAVLGALLTWAEVESAWFWAGTVGQYFALGAVPAVLLVAIVRHRLLDVDLVIRKSLVYGGLWTLIAVAYVAAATAVGLVGSQRLPVALAVGATVLVTLAFHPARVRLERLADRWVFGRRAAGHELMARLGRELDGAADQHEQLHRLADIIRDGMRTGWAEVRLASGDRAVAGSRGAREEAGLAADLRLHGSELGTVEVGARQDPPLSDADGRLLDLLARQAALVVHDAGLGRELAAQAAELTASRARIVAAGDLERRRIERDLHDGAQQRVVALLAGLRLTRNQLERAPAEAAETLVELERETQELHLELVELCRGIRPAVLTDHGLPEAIRSRSARLPIHVDLAIEPGAGRRLPDEIEGAAYFVCSEALTNVLKHAGVSRASVRLGVEDDVVRLEVRDDGHGFDLAAVSAHGLANMDDRVTALGGRLTVESVPGAGTLVRVALPVVRDRSAADTIPPRQGAPESARRGEVDA